MHTNLNAGFNLPVGILSYDTCSE